MKKFFKFICCGSVDDGKSTLIGRLLLDTGNVKKDQLQDALKASQKNGRDEIELAMLLDGLLSEREGQITIDIAHRYFDYEDIRFHILDCPGHEEYTKNMACAAGQADSAVIVVDLTKGIGVQTRRHLKLCSMLGVKNLCVCLTKVDLIYDEAGVPNQQVIDDLKSELEPILKEAGFNSTIIPVSAVKGVGIEKVLETLVHFAKFAPLTDGGHKILHIQHVKLWERERYYYFRTIGSMPREGEKLIVYPKMLEATVSKVHGVGCVSLCENLDISKGDTLSLKPLLASQNFKVHTVWFENPTPDMILKHGTRIVRVVSLSEQELSVDAPLFATPLNECRDNAFGIIIDNKTKRTIGTVVILEGIEKEAPLSFVEKNVVLDSSLILNIGLANALKVKASLQAQGFNVILEN